MTDSVQLDPYEGPAGGWGSAKSLTEILLREQIPVTGGLMLRHQNKPGGFMCVSCAWAKPGKPAVFEYCENGAKATAWEVTRKRVGADFFAAHTVTELAGWRDYDLEELGRLTVPLRWDAATDRYRPVSWDDAFAEIGAELKALEPKQAVFYASGRASLETSYMYGLLARLYGNNNLPDSSNMCHESTSVALPESIGSPVGTVLLEAFEHTDCILFFGQNPGSNAPRMLHPLQDASRRGVPIITFNPFRERGLERFTNPQAPLEMLTRSETRISSQYLQVKAGGDLGAIYGICKALLALDDAAIASGAERVLDTAFIAEHTQGFEAFAASVREKTWDELERHSGLTRKALEQTAATYAKAKATIGVYGMGLTQHRMGVETVQALVNLLLMRGNIGKRGAGICPVRGHSNVQGQRTVGITEKPELVPNDKLRQLYDFEPPMEKGLNTVEACEGILDGSVKAFVALGGNFIRAVPETTLMEAAWKTLRLTVQISTKLNRNHLIHGEVAYILPCLGRIEIDQQAGGRQAVSMEDSTACIHGSKGYAEPAGPELLSEPRIVAGIAKATLAPNPRIDWDRWGSDYASVRDAIEATYPDQFKDFNARMWTPGGFRRPIPAADRDWKTESGKANFVTPRGLSADPDTEQADPDVMRLITMRSNDQFNTTIYGYDDRFRGVKGTRMVLFMNRDDIARLGLRDAQNVDLVGAANDQVVRRVDGFRVLAYDIPKGCVGGYYPECNPLIPLWHHAERSKVPAAKSVPVRIEVASA
ncbi:FdhF/YdeP family oxidoreductase [Methylobacterium sp. E-041]|uniref:FdhF/YdeP family oxidoreductase n=1 Tax=unclassified Methylobacterium TaxID=2615210 RepID=UPI001FBB62D7|nr:MULTISPECIES: FdhF/YdeP family oxidoreductase [unclassified Methylobacterium]MCJ2104773.1 FdhF/YdeP family oxidoreductase [Methylobacterium sp. E-041]MCJ2113105.1 FdhF/YdeP family oxidoreductase [Methylobacterium sp. E-025]